MSGPHPTVRPERIAMTLVELSMGRQQPRRATDAP